MEKNDITKARAVAEKALQLINFRFLCFFLTLFFFTDKYSSFFAQSFPIFVIEGKKMKFSTFGQHI